MANSTSASTPDPTYWPSASDARLIDSINEHVRENPELYKDAAREIDHGKFSLKALKADRKKFVALVARQKKQWGKQELAAVGRARRPFVERESEVDRLNVDWEELSRRDPDGCTQRRIDTAVLELFEVWSGPLWSRSSSNDARRMLTKEQCRQVLLMTTVLFDTECHTHKTLVEFQRIPWEPKVPPGRWLRYFLLCKRGGSRRWLELARRAAEKCKLPVPAEAPADSAALQAPTLTRAKGEMPAAPHSRATSASVQTRRAPLNENARRVATVLLKLPEGSGLTRKEIPLRTGVPMGSISRTLRELRSWGVRMGARGSGAYIVDDAHATQLRGALNRPL